MTGNRSASILARLLTLAKQRGDDYNLLLNRFGMERLLARVSVSPFADRFLLKGALLFALWYGVPHRPTRDADLLGFGPDDDADLIATFREVASDDGAKLRQWQAFLSKNRIAAASLGDTVALLDDLLWPPTEVAAANSQATATWVPETLRWV